MLFFVYGTLKAGFPNHHHLPSACKLVGAATTVDLYPLVVADHFHGLPFLINQPGVGFHVHGEVYEVAEGESSTIVGTFLDQFEGVAGGMYERVSLSIAVDSAIGGDSRDSYDSRNRDADGDVLTAFSYVCGAGCGAGTGRELMMRYPLIPCYKTTTSFVAREDR